MTQKFIDRDGLKVLWNQVNLKDYPNNETLMAVIDAIDETKANKDEIVQSDWNQNDETASDYVKNRTHYEDIQLQEITFDFLSNQGGLDTLINLHETGNLTVVINDVEYTDLSYSFDGSNNKFTTSDNAYWLNYRLYPSRDLTTSNSITWYLPNKTVKTLDKKFLPEHLQFGEASEPSNIIEWDGDITGKETAVIPEDGYDICMVKVSELTDTLTVEDIVGGTISVVTPDGPSSITLISEMVHDGAAMGVPGISVSETAAGVEVLFICFNDFSMSDLNFTKGVWFLSLPASGVYVSSLRITKQAFRSEVISYLDSKYIEDMYRTETKYEEIINTSFDGMDAQMQTYFPLEVGTEYLVIWNGVKYKTTAYKHGSVNYLTCLGNTSSIGGIETDEPFGIITGVDPGNGPSSLVIGSELTGSSHTTFSIVNIGKVHKVPEKYIPDSIARVEYVDSKSGVGKDVTGQEFTIDGETITARKGAEIFNNYNNNKATGLYSHAEGGNTIASGERSHAEGNYTIASGTYSHAEGAGTIASGLSSHAEGYHTIAAGSYQHVQGRYNIEDTASKYAHIVGNGSYGSDIVRSNAHTVDWDGNAWFKGSIYVGGVGQDDTENVKQIATIDDVFEVIQGTRNAGKYTYNDTYTIFNNDQVCTGHGISTSGFSILIELPKSVADIKPNVETSGWNEFNFNATITLGDGTQYSMNTLESTYLDTMQVKALSDTRLLFIFDGESSIPNLVTGMPVYATFHSLTMTIQASVG